MPYPRTGADARPSHHSGRHRVQGRPSDAREDVRTRADARGGFHFGRFLTGLIPATLKEKSYRPSREAYLDLYGRAAPALGRDGIRLPLPSADEAVGLSVLLEAAEQTGQATLVRHDDGRLDIRITEWLTDGWNGLIFPLGGLNRGILPTGLEMSVKRFVMAFLRTAGLTEGSVEAQIGTDMYDTALDWLSDDDTEEGFKEVEAEKFSVLESEEPGSVHVFLREFEAIAPMDADEASGFHGTREEENTLWPALIRRGAEFLRQPFDISGYMHMDGYDPDDENAMAFDLNEDPITFCTCCGYAYDNDHERNCLMATLRDLANGNMESGEGIVMFRDIRDVSTAPEESFFHRWFGYASDLRDALSDLLDNKYKIQNHAK